MTPYFHFIPPNCQTLTNLVPRVSWGVKYVNFAVNDGIFHQPIHLFLLPFFLLLHEPIFISLFKIPLFSLKWLPLNGSFKNSMAGALPWPDLFHGRIFKNFR